MSQFIIDLTGEMLLLSTLGKLFQAYPEKEWIQSLVDNALFEEAPFGAEQAGVAYGLSMIQSWTQTVWGLDSESAFTEVETDYYHLFVGPGKVLAPPWESVYASLERLVFQEATLDVRNWYRRYDLQIEQLHHEPDDHIGLELSFLAHLSRLALQAVEEQDQGELERLLTDQRTFLSQHPLRWASQWCDLVDQHASTNFYRGLAHMALGGLQAAAEVLQVAVPAAA